MADNVTVTAGTFATDDVGGVQFPITKLAYGLRDTATDVSATNPLPVQGPATDAQLRAAALPVDVVVHTVATDRGGTITTGGSAQQIMATNTNRRGIAVQNQSTGDIYINGTGSAAIGPSSLRIAAGAFYETGAHAGTGAISIIGATTGQAFYAREW